MLLLQQLSLALENREAHDSEAAQGAHPPKKIKKRAERNMLLAEKKKPEDGDVEQTVYRGEDVCGVVPSGFVCLARSLALRAGTAREKKLSGRLM